jgi:hypothetical protein
MNPKILMLIGSVLIISSLYIASFMDKWIWFMVLYGVFFPIKVGLYIGHQFYVDMNGFQKEKEL